MMKGPLEHILQQTGLRNSYFAPTSRYFGLTTKILETQDHGKLVFVKRRIIESPDSFHVLQVHRVSQDDRLDNLSHEYLGDSEQFWRICDSNAAMHPNELTEEIGTKIKIALAAGMPGNRT